MATMGNRSRSDSCICDLESLTDPDVVTGIVPAIPKVQGAQATMNGSKIYETEVVIIGNGPSGLALSAFLAGWRPYYNSKNPHPNRLLHEKFSESLHDSLIDQDFAWLQEDQPMFWLDSPDGGGQPFRPFATLFDSLVRPDADMGHDHPSALRWMPPAAAAVASPTARKASIASTASADTAVTIPHVVLGKGPSGGSWHEFPPEMHTVSLARMMDLPGVGIEEFIKNNKKLAIPNSMGGSYNRVPCSVVQRYFRSYPDLAGIRKHQLPYTLVTAVWRETSSHSNSNSSPFWHVVAYHSSAGPFHFRARTLCLAAGVTVPRTLSVPGETALAPYIKYSVRHVDTALSSMDKKAMAPVLVVGDGITAGDAVVHCLIQGVPIIHSFRKSPRDVRNSSLGRLAASTYPEYQAVSRLMAGKAKDPLYTAYPNSQVVGFESVGRESRSVLLKQRDQELQLDFSYAVVCIGYEAGLEFFQREHGRDLSRDRSVSVNSKTNPLDIDPLTYGSRKTPNLYALGPLVGDNFVRFLVGGSLAAARDIVKHYDEELSVQS